MSSISQVVNFQISPVFASFCNVNVEPHGQMRISSIGPSYPECASKLCIARTGRLAIRELKDMEVKCLFDYSNNNIRLEMRVCCGMLSCDCNISQDCSCLREATRSGKNILDFVLPKSSYCRYFQIECWAINSKTGYNFSNIMPARARYRIPLTGMMFYLLNILLCISAYLHSF